MAKKAKVENPFIGIWRIVLMPDFDEKYLHEEVQAFIEFDNRNSGEFQFGYVHGFMDCRLSKLNGESVEMDSAQGRGVATLKGKELHGTIFFHQGDDYEFVARKSQRKKRK